MEADLAQKRSELENLYQDMGGVYEANDKSTSELKLVETKLRKQEESILGLSKQEMQMR